MKYSAFAVACILSVAFATAAEAACKGPMRNGRVHGEGICTYDNGTYTGTLVNGERHGRGRYEFSNGDVYDGSWVNGQRTGSGTLRFADGGVYSGEWLKDEIHDHGRYRYSNGNRYDGNWEYGNRSGRGEIKYRGGGRFEGVFQSDYPTYGTHTWSDGDFYEGPYINEWERTGVGKYSWVNENGDVYAVYEGDFIDGERTGSGKITHKWGDDYEGEFLDGEYHGRGTLTMRNGRVQSGQFVNGKFVIGPDSYIVFEDGRKFEGAFNESGELHGQGKVTWPDGSVFAGDFINNSMAEGVMTRPDVTTQPGRIRGARFDAVVR